MKEIVYPDVVLESAPMTTPPSNSIAAIVVYNENITQSAFIS